MPRSRTEVITAVGQAPAWMRICLWAAALQCLVWGPFIILAPQQSAIAYGYATAPRDLFLWQGMGLIILLYGVGYAVAGTDPLRHWLTVALGLLAKTLGPIGMTWAVLQGQTSPGVLRLIPIHDVIWWLPFALIVLRGIRSVSPATAAAAPAPSSRSDHAPVEIPPVASPADPGSSSPPAALSPPRDTRHHTPL